MLQSDTCKDIPNILRIQKIMVKRREKTEFRKILSGGD